MLSRKMSKLDQIRPRVEDCIESVMDFPKKGINFRNIMPLFAHPDLIKDLCDAISDHARSDLVSIDAVAGIEARGFLIGPQIAINLGVPFIPIRKKGKLPGECVQASYKKEYGEDVMEVQKGSFTAGSRILIVDDLLATGGTLKAAVDLLKKAGGEVAEAFLLIELKPLNGRNVVQGTTVTSLIQYDEA